MLSRTSHASLLAGFALTVFSAIVVVACSGDPTDIDQGTAESNLHGYGDGPGYGHGYGYGGYDGAHDVAADHAP